MKTLISMTAFVKEQKPNAMSNSLSNIINYANFLSLTPEIWQFVPCKLVDGVWVVLELPTLEWLRKNCKNKNGWDSQEIRDLQDQYQTAKERCYFEGFFIAEGHDTKPTDVKSITNGTLHVFWFNNIQGWFASRGIKTLEDIIPYNLPITATALKEIGL